MTPTNRRYIIKIKDSGTEPQSLVYVPNVSVLNPKSLPIRHAVKAISPSEELGDPLGAFQ